MNKRILILILCTALFLFLSACNDEAETPAASNETSRNGNTSANGETQAAVGENGNILIAYFSRMENMDFDSNIDATASASVGLRDGDYIGNNRIIAEIAAELIGGDIFSIETVHKYPAGYRATTDMAMDEKNANARPELSTSVENIENYDVIILVYPNWWATIPMPLFTFLEAYDFSGKTIAPICTHEGSGLGSSISDIRSLAPDATILDGLTIRGSGVGNSKESIETWLNGLGIFN